MTWVCVFVCVCVGGGGGGGGGVGGGGESGEDCIVQNFHQSKDESNRC